MPAVRLLVVMAVTRDEEMDLLHNAELKEAFDEFDKVRDLTSQGVRCDKSRGVRH